MLVFGCGGLIAVIHADDFTIPGKRELNRVGCSGINIPGGVRNIHGNIGKTGSVGIDIGSVGVHIQPTDDSGGRYGAVTCYIADSVSVFVVGFRVNRTGSISHIESRIQTCRSGTAYSGANGTIGAGSGVSIVDMAGRGLIVVSRCRTDLGIVKIQFHDRRVGINHDRCFTAGGKHIIAVPGGDEMQCGVVPIPLTAIEIIGIFGKTGGFHNTEITAVGNGTGTADAPRARAVPGSGFAEVVKTRPDEFAGHIVHGHGVPHGIMGGFAPADFRCIVRSQMVFPINVGSVGLRRIDTAAVHRRRSFRSNDRTVGAVHGTQLRGSSVVEAKDPAVVFDHGMHRTDGSSRIAIVTADGGLTGTVFRLCPIDQILRDGGITAVGAGAFLNFVPQRPEDHRRIVAVTLDRGFKGKFRPSHGRIAAQHLIGAAEGRVEIFTEIISVSVFRNAPAIEEFFDHHQTEFIADLNELLVRGIMAGADGVDAHIFHNGKLAVHSVVIGRGTEGALVVMETDTV